MVVISSTEIRTNGNVVDTLYLVSLRDVRYTVGVRQDTSDGSMWVIPKIGHASDVASFDMLDAPSEEMGATLKKLFEKIAYCTYEGVEYRTAIDGERRRDIF